MLNPIINRAAIIVHYTLICIFVDVINEDRNKTVWATFSAYLKSKRMRDTYERRAVLETVLGITRRFDYKDIIDALQTKGEQICRATVFNTLSLLTDAEILRRKQFVDGQYYYEPTHTLPSGNQLHTVCTSCGRFSTLRNSAIAKELSNLKPGTFLPTYFSLTVYGLCPRCQRRLRQNKRTN